MFVGDSPADIRAARNAGCASIAAMWGTLEANLLTEAGPDYVASEPFDVLQIVRDRLGEVA
jgi:phosphoglycolate phosphatase-like HAD superfamily hydrolase